MGSENGRLCLLAEGADGPELAPPGDLQAVLGVDVAVREDALLHAHLPLPGQSLHLVEVDLERRAREDPLVAPAPAAVLVYYEEFRFDLLAPPLLDAEGVEAHLQGIVLRV